MEINNYSTKYLRKVEKGLVVEVEAYVVGNVKSSHPVILVATRRFCMCLPKYPHAKPYRKMSSRVMGRLQNIQSNAISTMKTKSTVQNKLAVRICDL